MEHANFSPSRLKRIIECPGSVQLIEALVQQAVMSKDGKPSVYAEHGTMLHRYTDLVVCGNKEVLKELTRDDQVLVLDAIEYYETLLKSIGHSNLTVRNEAKVSLEPWGIPDVWGHMDLSVRDNIGLHMHVIDWKFGAGVMVFAKENPQALAYAAGAIGWPTMVKEVTVHIVQPAKDHYDTYTLSTSDLYRWVHSTLAVAISRCYDEPAKFNPGLEQCRWCEAKNFCDTRFTYAQNQAAEMFRLHSLMPTSINEHSVAELIEKASLVESIIKDFKLYAMNEITRGRGVKGLKLVRGRANRKWVNESATVKWLSDNTNIEEVFTSKLRSPSQMEKEMRALKRNEDFKKLFESPPGKLTLVPETDPRAAEVIKSDAVSVFKDYAGPAKLE